MSPFKKVAAAAAATTFLLVTIGGLVRATKSGLGCGTDWPHCSGRLLPALENRAMVIEYSHRFVAALVVLALVGVTVMAFRQDQPARIKRASLGAVGLVLFQALLGMLVVVLELEVISVVLHLATALLLLALVLYIAITADTGELSAEPRERDGPDRIGPLVTRAAAGVFVLLLVGSYVSGTQAGRAFADWPLMDGMLIPDLDLQAKAIHFLHRALAVVVGIYVLAAGVSVIRRADRHDRSRRLAHTALGLFLLEILIGAGNVLTAGNEVFVTLHLAVGAAIWASLVSLIIVTRTSRVPAGAFTERSFPALEGS